MYSNRSKVGLGSEIYEIEVESLKIRSVIVGGSVKT